MIVALALACGTLLAPSRYVAIAVVAGTVLMLFTLSAGFGGDVLAGAIVLIASFRLRGAPAPIQWIPAKLRDALPAATASVIAIFFAVSMASVLVPPGEGHVPLGSQDLRLMAGSRPSIWKSALETIGRSPVLGKGYSATVAYSEDPKVYISPDKLATLKGPIPGAHLEAHNVWLNVAGQAELVGIAAFGILLHQLMRGLLALFSPGLGVRAPLADQALAGQAFPADGAEAQGARPISRCCRRRSQARSSTTDSSAPSRRRGTFGRSSGSLQSPSRFECVGVHDPPHQPPLSDDCCYGFRWRRLLRLGAPPLAGRDRRLLDPTPYRIR